MATPPTDESKLLFHLLRDRQWHRYTEIRDKIALTVPPGRALRKYHTDIQSYARKAGKPDPNYQGTKTEDEKIQMGKTVLAQVTISGWKRAGVLLSQGEGRGREIKVRGGWTSTQFPGYEPAYEEDPAELAGGYTDPPSEHSELSESGQGPGNAVLGVKRPGKWMTGGRRAHPQEFANAVSPEGGVFAARGSVEGCDLCGLAVGNRSLHMKWHEAETQSDTPSEMALLDESQLRVVVRSEIIALLDQFQVGMQNHIDSRFAEVEGIISAFLRAPERWVKMDG